MLDMSEPMLKGPFPVNQRYAKHYLKLVKAINALLAMPFLFTEGSESMLVQLGACYCCQESLLWYVHGSLGFTPRNWSWKCLHLLFQRTIKELFHSTATQNKNILLKLVIDSHILLAFFQSRVQQISQALQVTACTWVPSKALSGSLNHEMLKVSDTATLSEVAMFRVKRLHSEWVEF